MNYELITPDLTNQIKKMSDEEKSKVIFLQREEGSIGYWRVKKLIGEEGAKYDPFEFETLVIAAKAAGQRVIFMSDPTDDLRITSLVGSSFALPLDERDRKLLLLVGETEFETPTKKWRYDVPGNWYVTDLSSSSSSPIIQFRTNK